MTPMPAHHESVTKIDDSVVIAKPVAEVFAFYKDFRNLPLFLGDVMEVVYTGDRSTRWTIQGPLGVQVHWTANITEIVENRQITYETSSDMLKTRWRITFAQGSNPGETIVREEMLEPGGIVTQAALAAIGKNPVKEVHHNLNRLKQYLETGKVTDTENAVAGKFDAK